MRNFWSALAAAPLWLWPLVATADQISLTYRDGGEVLTGELLDFDRESYRVDTVFGILTVNADAVSCAGEACPDLSRFVPKVAIAGAVAGERLFLPLLQAFAEARGLTLAMAYVNGSEQAYDLLDAAETRRARVVLRFLGADEGFADLLAGEADFVLSPRQVRPDEAERLREAGLGRLDAPEALIVIAVDAVVPLGEGIGGAVEFTAMTEMLEGTRDRWQDPGGREVPVTVVPGLDGDALRGLTVVKAQGGQIDGPNLRIGYFSERGQARAMRLAGSCGASVDADLWSLGSEDYPLIVPLYLVRPSRRAPPIVRDFLTFVESEDGAFTVELAGYASPFPQTRPMSEQGDRLARALALIDDDAALADLQALARDLAGAEQLSVGFRFGEGATDLDTPSMANVRVLARYLGSGISDGRTVVFAGFSDGVGAAAANRELSQDRAEAVRDAVAAALGPRSGNLSLTARGYGEGLPMACDADAWGRNANRRVEVWLR